MDQFGRDLHEKNFCSSHNVCAALLMTVCGGNAAQDTKAAPAKTETASTQTTPATGSKTLVVYLSVQGHTKQLAETTSKALGADLVEIVPKEPYTAHDLD